MQVKQPPLNHQQRCALLQNQLVEQSLDAAVISISTDLQFLTGLNLKKTERPVFLLIPAQKDASLVCPAFEQERIATLMSDLPTHGYDETGSPYELVAALLTDARRIALSERTWYSEFSGLKEVLPNAGFVGGDSLLAPLRWKKTAAEVARIRQSIIDWEITLAQLLAGVQPGTLASALRENMLSEVIKHGGNTPSCTVSVGATSALPHGGEDRPLAGGEVLLVDGGVAHDGYRSDITRTYVWKTPSAELRYVMQVVLDAQSAAIESVRPGVPAEMIDNAARKVITDAGYGAAFTHRIGHGLGLDGHEPPYLVAGNRQLLESGMVITVEPGIYLPGKFGIRIEDDLLVTETGAECLSSRIRHIDELVL